MVSVWPGQVRVRCQHPGCGRSMMEGPGPPGTRRVAEISESSSFASITRSPGGASALDTQRILLDDPSDLETARGYPKIAATTSAPSPMTCGMLESPENPALAHSGSGPVSIGEA